MDLVFFDLETTDADPDKARIVQAAFDIPGRDPLTFKCNPGIPIEPGATEAHGITDEDVADLPSFGHNMMPDVSGPDAQSYAEMVQEVVTGRTLVGYNCRRFDTPILHRELKRAGLPGLKTDAFDEIVHPEIDLFLCWRVLEPRTLTGALDRFGLSIDFGAHDAWEDTRVLDPLMHAMMGKLGHGLDVFLSTSCPEDEVDRDGKIKRDEQGVAVLAFGKHGGKPLSKVPRDYLHWITEKDFSQSTKAAVRRYLATGIL